MSTAKTREMAERDALRLCKKYNSRDTCRRTLVFHTSPNFGYKGTSKNRHR